MRKISGCSELSSRLTFFGAVMIRPWSIRPILYIPMICTSLVSLVLWCIHPKDDSSQRFSRSCVMEFMILRRPFNPVISERLDILFDISGMNRSIFWSGRTRGKKTISMSFHFLILKGPCHGIFYFRFVCQSGPLINQINYFRGDIYIFFNSLLQYPADSHDYPLRIVESLRCKIHRILLTIYCIMQWIVSYRSIA